MAIKPKNNGQQFISEVERAAEASSRPKGMPPLAEIETELKRHGFGKTDAESVYDYWLETGFKVHGRKVMDWRASVRNMIRFNRLPSQKTLPPGLVQHRKEKPAQLREAERDRRKAQPMSEEEGRRTAQALRKWRQDNR